MKSKTVVFSLRLLLLVTAVLLLTSCLSRVNNDSNGQSQENLPSGPLEGQVVLRCNQACTNRGQCGTLPDGNKVVLGRLEGPAVENHNLVFPTESTAVIQASSTSIVETIVNPTRSEQLFYQVVLSDNSKMGWVAGWCVRKP